MISYSRSRAVPRRGLLAFALVLAGVASISARPFAPGITFKVRSVTAPIELPGMPPQPEVVIVGHGMTLGSLSRLDIDSGPTAMPFAVGDYVLSLDSGRMFVVNPGSKAYSEGAPGMSALPANLMESASFTNVTVNVENLGAGEVMQGYPTQKYRLTTQYALAIMGTTLNTSTVQEMWVARLPGTVTTPFDGAIPLSMANGPMKELFDKTVAARKTLGSGTPIKTISTSSITGPMSLTTTNVSEIVDIKAVDVDEKMFKLPEGFTKKP